MTSWANTRVKLHSQVHFGSKEGLGPKKVWVQKYVAPKNFDQEIVLDNKILGSENVKLQKFLVLKNFGRKIF